MLSGRLRNSLRSIMVLGSLGGFVGSTFIGILSGSEFCPHEIVPVTWNLKYLPPSPSSGMLVDRNKSIFLHWELKSLFAHNVQILQNFLWLFCPQAWLPHQPVYLFISSLFSNGQLKRCWRTLYGRQFCFLSPYHCIPPWVRAKHGPRVHGPGPTWGFMDPGSMFLMDQVHGPSPK